MSTKAPSYNRGRLCHNKSQSDVKNLEIIMELQNKKRHIPKLTKTIYNINEEDVKLMRENRDYQPKVKESGSLYDYQTLAVAFMLYSKSCMIGDSVGLGKTAELSALVNILRKRKEKQGKPFRYLYLTEKTSLIATTNKLIQFTGEHVQEVFGTKLKVEKFLKENPLDVPFTGGISGTHSIIKNSNFHSWVREQSKRENSNDPYFDLFIIDESAVIANNKSDYTKLAKELRGYSKDVILLNASPFESNLMAMYHQLDFLNPNLMPNIGDFLRRFVKYDPILRRYDFKAGYTQPEVFRREVSLIYFANTRRNLEAKFENCTVELKESSLTSEQKRLLNNTSMPNLVYDCPQVLDPSIPFTPEYVSKLQSLDEAILENGLDDGTQAHTTPMIIFCHYTEAQKHLKEYLENEWGAIVGVINGKITSAVKRQEVINDFKDRQITTLITSVYRGLDLETGDIMVFYSLPASPGKILQTEGRVTRSLHVKNKSFYILTTKGKEKTKLAEIRHNMKSNNDHTSPELSLIGAFLTGEEI